MSSIPFISKKGLATLKKIQRLLLNQYFNLTNLKRLKVYAWCRYSILSGAALQNYYHYSRLERGQTIINE